jgi:hypothetical protein
VVADIDIHESKGYCILTFSSDSINKGKYLNTPIMHYPEQRQRMQIVGRLDRVTTLPIHSSISRQTLMAMG